MKKKEAKEIRKKRREMELTIWSKMSPEEKSKEIEARKERSTAEYQAIFTKSEARRKMIEEGRAFVLKNQVETFCWEFGAHHVFAGALLKTGANNVPYYFVSYTICSPKDSLSLRVGEGYVGDRLKSEAHPYRFEIMLSRKGALSRKRLNSLCYAHILMDIVARRVKVPSKLEGFCLRSLGKKNVVKPRQKKSGWKPRATKKEVSA